MTEQLPAVEAQLIAAGVIPEKHDLNEEELAAIAQEYSAALRDTMASATPRLKDVQIEIMHGAAMFKLPGEEQPVETFDAVILKAANQAAYYRSAYKEGTNEQPDCASHDMRNGSRSAEQATDRDGNTVTVFGECASCHYNRFGSSRLGGNAKECTNYKVLLLKVPKREFPMILRAAPTSIRAVDSYLVGLANQRLPMSGVRTRFALRRETDKYCVLGLTMEKRLPADLLLEAGRIKASPSAQMLLRAPLAGDGEAGGGQPAQIEHQGQERAEAQPKPKNTAPAPDPAPSRTPPPQAGEPAAAAPAEEGF